jgi:hypothetical protein
VTAWNRPPGWLIVIATLQHGSKGTGPVVRQA